MPQGLPQRDKDGRFALLAGLAVASFGVVVLGLLRLQVLQHDELTRLSEQNRIRLDVIRAPRGAIRDRSGRILADNQPSFDIVFRPAPIESTLRVRMTKRGRLTTLDSNAPGKIAVANEAARIAAELVRGDAGSSINEVVLGTPTTAHILGGATTVNEPGLHIVDGSAVGANLGVNPSLTIAAQAERAMSLWPTA